MPSIYAVGQVYQFASRQANEEALRLFNSAIELDPDFASAYGRACLLLRLGQGQWLDFSHSRTRLPK
jgi:hypothetical protein